MISCNRTRGAIAGVIHGVLLAILFALGEQGEPAVALLDPPWFVNPRDPTFCQLFLAVAMHALPVGILWGALVGLIAHEVRDSWGLRFWSLPFISLVLVVISCLPWGALLPYAIVTVVPCSLTLACLDPPISGTEDPAHP